MPGSDRCPNDFAGDHDRVRRKAARTSPLAFLRRAVRRPSFYQDIRLSVTTDAVGSDGLRIFDVHANKQAIAVV